MQIFDILKEWEAYIGIVLLLITSVLHYYQIVDNDVFTMCATVLAGLIAATIKKAQNKTDAVVKQLLEETRSLRQGKNST